MVDAPAETHRDAPYRSFLKAVSWRITGSVDTFILSWLVTGSTRIAVTISGIEVFTKIFLFYLHERIWMRIQWGQNKNNDYNI